MKDKKPFWKSGTLLGILIFLAPTVTNILGYNLIPILVSGTISGDELCQLAGAIMAAYNRIKATHMLTMKPVEDATYYNPDK